MSGIVSLQNPANYKSRLTVYLAKEYIGSDTYVVKVSEKGLDRFKNIMKRGGNSLGIEVEFINK